MKDALRHQLIELDNQIAILGEDGLFNKLDRDGVLDHRVEPASEIIKATTQPPSEGRARLRGEFIRDFAAKGGSCACDWMFLWDGDAHKQAIMEDPFTISAQWEHHS